MYPREAAEVGRGGSWAVTQPRAVLARRTHQSRRRRILQDRVVASKKGECYHVSVSPLAAHAGRGRRLSPLFSVPCAYRLVSLRVLVRSLPKCRGDWQHTRRGKACNSAACSTYIPVKTEASQLRFLYMADLFRHLFILLEDVFVSSSALPRFILSRSRLLAYCPCDGLALFAQPTHSLPACREKGAGKEGPTRNLTILRAPCNVGH